ncbi:MAG: MinD/ParA family protein [Desulfobacteraceae bacterium]
MKTDQADGLRNIVKSDGLSRGNTIMASENSAYPRVIAVTSGKGGVGKTNIVGNLAVALSRAGKRVVIVDADVGLANIDIIFNLQPKYNISHVVAGEKSLDEIMVRTSHGIRIVPGGSGFAHLTQFTEGEKLNLLNEFETLKKNTDIVLVDTGAGISSNVLYFNCASDECIVVATREPTSITDAYALMKVLSRDYGTRYFKLVVNMVTGEKEAKSVFASLSGALDRFLKNVLLEYTGYIPMDKELSSAVQKRKIVLDSSAGCAAGKAFIKIAENIQNSERRYSSSGNLNFFMNRVMEMAE